MMLHLFSTFFYLMFFFQLDYSDYTQEIDGSDLSIDMVSISGENLIWDTALEIILGFFFLDIKV